MKRIETVERVREFNRDYTVIIGLLSKNFLNTEYSVTETRIFFELQNKKEVTANYLMETLQLDKSYISRIIKSFEKKGLIERKTSKEDRRYNFLNLTAKGREEVANLINISNEQINKLLEPLSDAECSELINAMDTITNYLN